MGSKEATTLTLDIELNEPPVSLTRTHEPPAPPFFTQILQFSWFFFLLLLHAAKKSLKDAVLHPENEDQQKRKAVPFFYHYSRPFIPLSEEKLKMYLSVWKTGDSLFSNVHFSSVRSNGVEQEKGVADTGDADIFYVFTQNTHLKRCSLSRVNIK